MIDLTGPLVRARLTMLLGGRPFDVEVVPGVGTILTIHHEHADVHAETAITATSVDPVNAERLRADLEAMVTALDKAAYPDRVARFSAAVREYHRLEREHFDEVRRVPRMHPTARKDRRPEAWHGWHGN